jgi:hypothetical protein
MSSRRYYLEYTILHLLEPEPDVMLSCPFIRPVYIPPSDHMDKILCIFMDGIISGMAVAL